METRTRANLRRQLCRGKSISPSEWREKKHASNRDTRCYLCRCQVNYGNSTVDHLIPSSKGGRDVATNYRLACKPCNNARGSAWATRSVLKAAGIPAHHAQGSALADAIKRHRAAQQPQENDHELRVPHHLPPG